MNKNNLPDYLYLHGFASGPRSTKADFFKKKLEDLGINLVVPDLNQPAFESMTVSSQLDIVNAEVQKFGASDNGIVIIGSSMGGLLATISAQYLLTLRALVLLAPGFGLPRRWQEQLGSDGLENWRKKGTVDVFHYAHDKELPLAFQFILDAETHQTDGLKVHVPTIVFHGRNDQTVPVQESENFKIANAHFADLQILDDDHMLITSLESIWLNTKVFLQAHDCL